MTKAGTISDTCPSCEWRKRLIMKMSLAVDKLSHELDTTEAKYGGPGCEFKDLLAGRKLQQAALLREFDLILDEEEFNMTEIGIIH